MNSKIMTIIAIVAVVILAYFVLNTREDRTVGQKMSDAVEQLDNGVDNAARELQDRTPAEKIKDAVDDAKE